MDIISCHLALATPNNRFPNEFRKACRLAGVNRIALTLNVRFVYAGTCIGTYDASARFPRYHDALGMNVDRIFPFFYLTDN